MKKLRKVAVSATENQEPLNPEPNPEP